MPYFRDSRNVELSTLDYLSTNLSADWSGITLIKTFNDAYDKSRNVPIVCVRLNSTNSVRREIGNTTLENRYLIIIDIWARSDAQRLDLADYIEDKLALGWVYNTYAHTSGDKSTLVATSLSRCTVTDWISNTRVEVGEGVDEKDKYHHIISVLVRKDLG